MEVSVMDTNTPVIFHTPDHEHNHVVKTALDQMKLWFGELYGHKKAVCCLNVCGSSPIIYGKMWTFSNTFTINATFRTYDEINKSVQSIIDDGYLGASARSRKSRTGEDWLRGNDLADGKFNEETWISIIKSILSYEIEDIKSYAWKDGGVPNVWKVGSDENPATAADIKHVMDKVEEWHSSP